MGYTVLNIATKFVFRVNKGTFSRSHFRIAHTLDIFFGTQNTLPNSAYLG